MTDRAVELDRCQLTSLRAGDATSTALTERALEVARASAAHNALIDLDAERALEAAWRADREPGYRGPLHGVPMIVKDNIHVAGMPNTAGTPALAGFVPPEDAPVISRLRDAGALVIGKANLHELSMGITGGESAAGAVRNAVDPTRISGGSSSGTAVLVALGMLAGLGTDTAGSVRIPAALNGVCGLRPTTGRYPREAITPLCSTRDTVGPMAATIADLTVLDGVLAGIPLADAGRRPPADNPPRLGIPSTYWARCCDSRVTDLFDRALERLRSDGIEMVEVGTEEQVAMLDGIERRFGLIITAFEARRELTNYLRTYRPELSLDQLVERISGAEVRDFFLRHVVDDAPLLIQREDYLEAMSRLPGRLLRWIRKLYRTNRLDAVIYPTTPSRAAPLGSGGAEMFDLYTRHTAPGSLSGLPGLTLPIPVPPGELPVGLSLEGPPSGDRALLALGCRIERILTSPGH